MRRLFFICSLLLTWSAGFGQDSLADRSVKPPALFLAIDYGKLATLPTNFETKWEGGLGFRIGKHLMPVFFGGFATLEPENAISNGTYESKGWYFRTGLEYVLYLDLRNSLILGARYGQSNFSEDASYIVSSDLFEEITGEVSRTDLSARWAEIVLGSEMQLGESPFYIGGYFTLRIMIDRDEYLPVDTYAIPGYGRTIDKTIPALQLHLKAALFR